MSNLNHLEDKTDCHGNTIMTEVIKYRDLLVPFATSKMSYSRRAIWLYDELDAVIAVWERYDDRESFIKALEIYENDVLAKTTGDYCLTYHEIRKFSWILSIMESITTEMFWSYLSTAEILSSGHWKNLLNISRPVL